MTGTVVVKSKDLLGRLSRTFATLLVLVKVVAKMKHIVVLILACGIAIGVEVSVGYSVSDGSSPDNVILTEVAA